MSQSQRLPKILVVDDFYGRILADKRNVERANFCARLGLVDVTGDEKPRGANDTVHQPIAQAAFCRGQRPTYSEVGDRVQNDLSGTLEVIRNGWINPTQERPPWSLILLDLEFKTGEVTEESNKDYEGMPGGSSSDRERYFGLTLLEAIHDSEELHDLPVIILSSMDRQPVARTYTSLGALAFFPKSSHEASRPLSQYIRDYGLIPDQSGRIIGTSVPLLLALRTGRQKARDRANVLIKGERGTGKELLARYIHEQSQIDQDHRPFEIVNSGGLTPELYASELFGHKRGAFTGAERDRKGRMVQANRGDLFLDEIGNMPSNVQMGLLRAIEYGEVQPVGSDQSTPVDVRCLAATNEDIEQKAETGEFRADLLDRLRQGGTLFLPPLRERLEDIPLLVEYFVRQAEQDTPGAVHRTIEHETIAKVCSYQWPGNVRELKSCIYAAVSSFRDMEYFVPGHIRLPVSEPTEIAESTSVEFPRGVMKTDLEALVTMTRGFDFESISPSHLAGALPVVQSEFARLVARLLGAALRVTARRTPENPEGLVQIHPAIKLITGNSTTSASKAADIVKRLLNIDPALTESLLSDPVLRTAYVTALRLRPRKPQKKTGSS